MAGLLKLALALALTCAGAVAQEAGSYDAAFERGMAAYEQGRFADAAQQWKLCLEARPRDPRAAYNVACMHALLGEVDAGIGWLERAVDYGFGLIARDHPLLREDGDLAALRADPRFAPLLERVDADRKRVAEYTSEVSAIPVAGAEQPPPLLVVLHDRGSTRERVLGLPADDGGPSANRWRRIASELGAVLVAPSGLVPLQRDPAQGMAWLEQPEQLLVEPHEVERGLAARIRQAVEAHGADPRRVLLAGEGEGAGVAFDLALRSPGLVRGVIAVRPTVVAQSDATAESAGRMGLRAHLIWTRPAPIEPAEVARLGAWLGEKRIAGSARLVEVEGERELDALLLGALRGLLDG